MEDRTEAPAERVSGPGPDAPRAEDLAFPVRAAGDVVGRVRPTDDPEMLETILARLLNRH